MIIVQKQAYYKKTSIVFESMESTAAKAIRYDEGSVALPMNSAPFIHYHNRIEVGICTTGLGIFYGNDFAESVKPGDIVLFFPHRAHYSHSMEKSPCMCRFAYLSPQSLIFNLFDENNRINVILNDSFGYDLPAVIRQSEYPDMHGILYAMLNDLFSQCSANSELLCALRLCEFLAKIPQHFKKIKKAQDFKFPKPDNPIASVEAFISAHYYENITAKKLCGICFLSESQLRRKFKSVYGTSPMQYLKNLRSTIAAKLLLQTDLSVGEISTRVGYTDVSVFYRHFVTIFGISPTEYKKRAAHECGQ